MDTPIYIYIYSTQYMTIDPKVYYSIGLVADKNHSFYAEFTEFDYFLLHDIFLNPSGMSNNLLELDHFRYFNNTKKSFVDTSTNHWTMFTDIERVSDYLCIWLDKISKLYNASCIVPVVLYPTHSLSMVNKLINMWPKKFIAPQSTVENIQNKMSTVNEYIMHRLLSRYKYTTIGDQMLCLIRPLNYYCKDFYHESNLNDFIIKACGTDDDKDSLYNVYQLALIHKALKYYNDTDHDEFMNDIINHDSPNHSTITFDSMLSSIHDSKDIVFKD